MSEKDRERESGSDRERERERQQEITGSSSNSKSTCNSNHSGDNDSDNDNDHDNDGSLVSDERWLSEPELIQYDEEFPFTCVMHNWRGMKDRCKIRAWSYTCNLPRLERPWNF